jgi:hypothetical protein
MASVVKGADHVKKVGNACFYSIRLLMFGIFFHSLWEIASLLLLGYDVTAANASFHGLIAALLIWTIYFHRRKTTIWKQHGSNRKSTAMDRHKAPARPTAQKACYSA